MIQCIGIQIVGSTFPSLITIGANDPGTCETIGKFVEAVDYGSDRFLVSGLT